MSKLKGCTIENNFYGGGSLGKVVGTVTSELDGCEVKGNVFGAGYSASLPTLEVRDAGFDQNPKYNSASGMFEPGIFSGTTTFTWKKASSLSNGGSGSDVTDDHRYIYTTLDITSDNLGTVQNAELTLKGNTTVDGSVFGGGDASAVSGNATVTLKGATQVEGDVFGGGNKGMVSGKTTVKIKKDGE